MCTKYNDYYSQCVPATSTRETSTGVTSQVSTTSIATSTSRVTTSTTSAAPQPSGAGPSRLVGKTPALGWNSWNAYQGNINEAKIRAAADALVSLGLKDAGYNYVNIDDCWSNITGRDVGTSRIKPDLNKFPNGIKSVADYIHSLGLLVGIYSDAGTLTCAGFPGSLGYENIDAQTFAEWGIDYLKYDNCNVPNNWTDTYGGPDFDWYNSNSGIRYRQMTSALASVASIRPIQYGICNWGNADVWTWGSRVGHSWRMSGDSSASWSYITSIIARNTNYLNYVDDMDMMEIGNGALTINSEQRTHFAMWVALKSPILLGTDLSKLNATQLAIIKNAELLAFSQDTTVGAPAKPYKSGTTTPPEYYTGKSAKGTHVFIMNVGSAPASKIVTFSEMRLLGNWAHLYELQST
ncbi:Alpha galactosidase A, partial [Rhizoctonia solani]